MTRSWQIAVLIVLVCAGWLLAQSVGQPASSQSEQPAAPLKQAVEREPGTVPRGATSPAGDGEIEDARGGVSPILGLDSPDDPDSAGLVDWQQRQRNLLRDLIPGSDHVSATQLVDLREKANLTEALSIATANGIREALQRQNPRDSAAIARLRSDLRTAVANAFKARHDLHFMEVTSLTMKAQAMQNKLREREASYSEIVDRRVDDLLNPAKLWTTDSPVPNGSNVAGSSWPAYDNKLLIRKSETAVKVEGELDGREEILLIIGEPKITAQLTWTVPVKQAGEYTIEVRREIVKIDGGKTAPGIVFQVRQLPDTLQSTTNITFTETDPLPNGKMVINPQGNKLLLKRKADIVLVLVGHVELPDNSTIPVHIMVRRKPVER